MTDSTTSPDQSKIYRAGLKAGYEGKTRSACPYSRWSAPGMIWMNGWAAGMAQWLQGRLL